MLKGIHYCVVYNVTEWKQPKSPSIGTRLLSRSSWGQGWITDEIPPSPVSRPQHLLVIYTSMERQLLAPNSTGPTGHPGFPASVLRNSEFCRSLYLLCSAIPGSEMPALWFLLLRPGPRLSPWPWEAPPPGPPWPSSHQKPVPLLTKESDSNAPPRNGWRLWCFT